MLFRSLGGHTSCVVSALPTGAPYAKAGNVRALAMMSARRSPLLPDVPTMAEATGIGLEADIVTGLVAPAGTPKEVVSLLHRAITNIVAPPEFNDRLLALGFDPVASNSGYRRPCWDCSPGARRSARGTPRAS